MRFIMKPTAAVLALTFAALSFSSAADARDRYWRHHRHNDGDALAAGIIGFAAGAILGGALSQPRDCPVGYVFDSNYGCVEPLYRAEPAYAPPPPPAVVYDTVPAYSDGLEPWTREWYAYCDHRYRSFNADTGYFYGFDGKYHFCR